MLSKRCAQVFLRTGLYETPVFNLSQRMSTSGKPIEESITKKLISKFQPNHLEVINESSKHNVPKGSETHFKVIVISDQFESIPLIKRHRLVHEVLQEELQSGVHALSILAKTQSQWDESNHTIAKSPPCRGGTGL